MIYTGNLSIALSIRNIIRCWKSCEIIVIRMNLIVTAHCACVPTNKPKLSLTLDLGSALMRRRVRASMSTADAASHSLTAATLLRAALVLILPISITDEPTV